MLSIIIRGTAGTLFLVLGLIGVFSPQTSRRFISNFLKKAPVRVLGVVLMLLGAGVFRVASHLYLPLAGKAVGVILFMAGGVHIFIPEFAIVLNEWWVLRKPVWERLVGVVYLAIALLCFMPQEGISWPARRELPEFQQAPVAPPEWAPDSAPAAPEDEAPPAAPQPDEQDDEAPPATGSG